MSPAEITKNALLALAAEIRDDLAAIARLLPIVLQARAAVQKADDPMQIMAAAGYLHHLYTATESIHERVVRLLDGAVPTGERSHHDLLTRVGVEVPGVRPAVLTPTTRARLARLLRFRHFFRHAYRIDLLAEEVLATAAGVELTFADYDQEVQAFCHHLELAAQDQG